MEKRYCGKVGDDSLMLRSFCHACAPQAGIQMPLRLLDASTEYAAVSLKSPSCARLDSRLRGNDPRRSGRKPQSLPRRRLGIMTV